ncbi:MAG: alcohol dehydrogenase catalytic domain-containing protein, partial [Alphaproteobacteria bacterium]
MKAAYMNAQGGPEVLVYGDVPDPVAGEGEIVADIHAASVNGADWKVRAGSYAPITEFPYILGRDFSGTVASLGNGVTDFAIGDPVFGVLAPGHEGTYCEKVAEQAAICAAKPDSMSHVEAAALALT